MDTYDHDPRLKTPSRIAKVQPLTERAWAVLGMLLQEWHKTGESVQMGWSDDVAGLTIRGYARCTLSRDYLVPTIAGEDAYSIYIRDTTTDEELDTLTLPEEKYNGTPGGLLKPTHRFAQGDRVRVVKASHDNQYPAPNGTILTVRDVCEPGWYRSEDYTRFRESEVDYVHESGVVLEEQMKPRPRTVTWTETIMSSSSSWDAAEQAYDRLTTTDRSDLKLTVEEKVERLPGEPPRDVAGPWDFVQLIPDNIWFRSEKSNWHWIIRGSKRYGEIPGDRGSLSESVLSDTRMNMALAPFYACSTEKWNCWEEIPKGIEFVTAHGNYEHARWVRGEDLVVWDPIDNAEIVTKHLNNLAPFFGTGSPNPSTLGDGVEG